MTGRVDGVAAERNVRERGRADAAAARVKSEPAPAQALEGLPSRWAVAAIGVLGLGLWACTAAAPSLSPRLEVNRSEAEAAARAALAAQGVDPREWTESSRVSRGFRLDDLRGGRTLQHRFVWNEAGEERYAALLGEYLAAPHWRVRYARFDVDHPARVEEHVVHVGPDGAPRQRDHQLALVVPGAAPSEEEARALALAALGGPAAAANLSAAAAYVARRPARTDWTFHFRDETVGDLAGGGAGVTVRLAGDEVLDVRRRIGLPDGWAAADRQRGQRLSLALVLSTIALELLVVAGAVLGWTRRAFDFRAALAAGGVVLAVASSPGPRPPPRATRGR